MMMLTYWTHVNDSPRIYDFVQLLKEANNEPISTSNLHWTTNFCVCQSLCAVFGGRI
ncbi:MAG: hypothetical protein ACI94O_002507 [Octadecabacter sp.]|jgi:hypothetical protein